MLYRGYKIERIIRHANEPIIERADGVIARIRPANTIVYAILEPRPGRHWSEVTIAETPEAAMGLIDDLLRVRASA